MFDAGDMKLVILKLLSEQPSYGYQLIKTMEERLAGGYTPSAGVIYPTLTMLEEEGLAASADGEQQEGLLRHAGRQRSSWRRTSAGSRRCSSGWKRPERASSAAARPRS